MSEPIRNRVVAGIGAILLFVASTCFATIAAAQELKERGLVRVGINPADTHESGKPELWAVLVGISTFKNGGTPDLPNLQYADDDAKALAGFLKSPEGGGFRDVADNGHLVLLTNEQATKAAVEAALAQLKQTKPDDYVVIFFASHGVPNPEKDPETQRNEEVGYFLVHDTNLDDFQRTALRMQDFYEYIKNMPARKGLVLVDTCHSEGFITTDATSTSRGLQRVDTKRANSRFIDEMSKVVEGVAMVSAADRTENSFEDPGAGHGIFTLSVLEALGGAADSADENGVRDGVITYKELQDYLYDRVPARALPKSQHPQFKKTATAYALRVAAVTYAGAGADAGSTGAVLLSVPELDGVEAIIDGQSVGTIRMGIPRTLRVAAGDHKLQINKEGVLIKPQLISVVANETNRIEVNLTFSKSDEEDLVGAPSQQVNVYLTEDANPPAEAVTLFQKGVDSFNKQRFDDAVAQLKAAIDADGGKYTEAYIYKGQAEQALNRFNDAMASFKQALVLRPSDFQAKTLLAEAKFQARVNTTEVLDDLLSVIARHPNDDFAHTVLADVHLYRGEFVEAERAARRAILAKPASPPAHMILADILTNGQTEAKQLKAIEEADKAVTLFEQLATKKTSVKSSLAHLSLSHLVFGGGRYANADVIAEAHHMLAKALTNAVWNANSRGFDAILAKQDEYLARGRREIQSATRLAEGLQDKTRLVMVLDTSAQNFFCAGDLKSAIKDGELAIKTSALVPNPLIRANASLTLAMAYDGAQQFAKAAENYKAFLDVKGSSIAPQERQSIQDRLDQSLRQAKANRQKP